MGPGLGGMDPPGGPVMSVSLFLGRELPSGEMTGGSEGTSCDSLPSSPLPRLGPGDCHPIGTVVLVCKRMVVAGPFISPDEKRYPQLHWKK